MLHFDHLFTKQQFLFQHITENKTYTHTQNSSSQLLFYHHQKMGIILKDLCWNWNSFEGRVRAKQQRCQPFIAFQNSIPWVSSYQQRVVPQVVFRDLEITLSIIFLLHWKNEDEIFWGIFFFEILLLCFLHGC